MSVEFFQWLFGMTDIMADTTKGGPGSGNIGHAGRPGLRGGSAPRKVGGKWKSIGVHDFTKQDYGALTDAAQSGGFTYNPRTKDMPSSGYAVAVRVLHSEQKADLATANKRFLRQYLRDWADVLAIPGTHLGGWIDDEGRLCLDISLVPKSREMAMGLGYLFDQDAIFHLDTFEEIRIRGNPEAKKFADTGKYNKLYKTLLDTMTSIKQQQDKRKKKG